MRDGYKDLRELLKYSNCLGQSGACYRWRQGASTVLHRGPGLILHVCLTGLLVLGRAHLILTSLRFL